MLNFLRSIVDESDGIVYFFVIAIALIICVAGFIKRKIKEMSDADDTYADDDNDDNDTFSWKPNSQGFLTEEQRRYQNTLKQRKNAQKPQQTSVTADDGHSHHGEVETYEPIVGSLGSVGDEGCVELDGVRLIVTDLMYETNDQTAYDLDSIGKSIVLGEVLNNPRFKTPYGKR